LKHKAYDAAISVTVKNLQAQLRVTYKQIKRELVINYTNSFPYLITSWEEKSTLNEEKSVWVKGTLISKKHSPYWNKNLNKDTSSRRQIKINRSLF